MANTADCPPGRPEPSWVIRGQEFDGAESVLLILPAWLAITLELRLQDRLGFQIFFKNSRYKDGTTWACSLAFSPVPYRALQSDRCLVITT